MADNAEADDFGNAEDAVMGAGRALMVCIHHLRTSNEGTATMTYQIELEGGKIETYEISVKTAPLIVEAPSNSHLH